MSQSASTAVPRLPKAGLLILALVFAELLSAVELAMMYVALPTLMRDFIADTNAVAWVVSGYMLVAACAAALGGRLGDMYGRRRVLLIACVLAAVGSVVSLLSVTLTMLIVGRAIQGAAGAIMALAFGLAREYLPEKRKQTGISIIGAAALIGGAMGAMVAGIVVQSFSWHGIFILSGVLAVVSFLAVLMIVPRDGKTDKGTRLDVPGAILLPIAVASLLLSLNFGKDYGFGSANFLAPIAIALIVGTAWVFWELRAPSPIVNVRMLKNKQVSRVMLATLLISIGPIGGLAVPLALLQQYPTETGFGYGLTPTAVGLLTAVTALVGFAASPVGGTIAHKFGARTMFIITAIALVIGAGIILFTMGNLPLLIVALTITTAASGLFFGALGNVLFEAVPLSHSSEVAGTAMMIRNIGQSAGTAVTAFIIGLFFVPATGGISHQGFIVAITVVAILGAAGVAVSLFLSRRPQMWQPLVAHPTSAETELVPQQP